MPNKFKGFSIMLTFAAAVIVAGDVSGQPGSSCSGHAVVLSNSRQLPSLAGGNCSSSSSSWDASSRVNSALSNAILQLWFNASCEVEVCQSNYQVAAMQRQRWTQNSVYTNVDREDQLEFLQQFRTTIDAFGTTGSFNQPVFANVPSRVDATVDLTTASTVFEPDLSNSVFTPGPSVHDLAETAYQFVVAQNWTYIAAVTSTNRGDRLFVDRLQQLASSGPVRLCLGTVLTATSSNATVATERLKGHAYVDKKLSSLAVLVAAPSEIVGQMMQLVSGGDNRYADSGRRYQWVLMGGDAFRYVGQQMSVLPAPATANSLIGSVLIRPGVVDYNPGQDSVVSQVLNATLKWLSPEFLHCNWSDPSSSCYASTLNYDHLLLSLLPVLSQAPGSWVADASLLSSLRSSNSGMQFSSLTTLASYYRVFTELNYTRYSFRRGLYHQARGFSAPAVKVFNVQQVSGSKKLVKIGELTVDNNGDRAQRLVTWLTGGARFYIYNESTGSTLEVSSRASYCFNICPECLPTRSGIVEFSAGDYYIGIIAPVHYPVSDRLHCSDGTLRDARQGGYQFALAAKFILQVANYLGNLTGSTPAPVGFNASLLDQQYLTALRGLQSSATAARGGKWPKLGYVIIDSCYLGPYTARNLNLLLNGKLSADVPGFHYSKAFGFVGALSSTCTMAASEVLKQFGLPLVSYGSTSTVLNDVVEYPYVARTVVTDRVIVQSIVQLLRYLQANYTVVVYADTDYGRSLRNQLFSLAAEAGICVGRSLAHTMEDSVSNANLVRLVAEQGIRYVPFLGSMDDLKNFLDFAGAETAAAGVTLLTTEAVGASGSWLDGRWQLGVGCISVAIDTGNSLAFVEHQRSLLAQPPSDTEKPWPAWLVSYLQSARGCHLASEFARTSSAVTACGVASLGEQAGLGFLDSRALLAADAAAALVLGGLATIGDVCDSSSSATSEACDARLQNLSRASMQARGNRVLFGSPTGGSLARPRRFGDYGKIADDRTGSNRLSLWQFRSVSGGSGWEYVQIGSFSSSTGLQMLLSLDSIQSSEKSTARAACSQRSCVRPAPAVCVNGATIETNESSSSGLLALLLLLLLLPAGGCAGYFSADIWLSLRPLCQRLRRQPAGEHQPQFSQPPIEMNTMQSKRGTRERPLPAVPPQSATSSELPAPMMRRPRQPAEASGASAAAGSGNGRAVSGQSIGSYAVMRIQHSINNDPRQPHLQHPARQEGSYENDTCEN